MDRYNIYIDSLSYRKINKKLLKYNIKIGGMNIRDFIIANSIIDDKTDAMPLRIKRIILHIAGDFDTRSSDLNDGLHLDHGLLFGHNEYILLRRFLDRLVKEYEKGLKITAQEVLFCKIVGDCVNLVNSKISHITANPLLCLNK